MALWANIHVFFFGKKLPLGDQKKVHGTDTKDVCENNSPNLPDFEENIYGIAIFKQ
jgi:hypothetical protein